MLFMIFEVLEETGETIQKDELDYEVVVIKKRNVFLVCTCKECARDSHVPIPDKLKEENQYGSRVRALALILMNIGNVSVHKVRKMIHALSEEEINPSEGYIIKQQKQAFKALSPFVIIHSSIKKESFVEMIHFPLHVTAKSVPKERGFFLDFRYFAGY